MRIVRSHRRRSALSGRGVVHAVLAAIFLILPASALAQQVGVKAGANFASLTPEEDEDPDRSRRLGPVAGVWVRLPSSKRFSLQVEGLFSEKGVKFKAPAIGVDSADIRLRYLEIPVLARADVGATSLASRAFIVGGAAAAFKLAARTSATSEGRKESRDIADEIYALDIGLVAGFGLEFGRALIEVRYTHGLRHINTDDNGDGDRIKNRVFSVTAGFRLRYLHP